MKHPQYSSLLLLPSPHLAVDEGDAISVAGQLSDRLRSVLPQRPSVPHLAQRVVAAREEQLGRAVGERHRIHVVLVGINLTGRAAEEKESVFHSGGRVRDKCAICMLV